LYFSKQFRVQIKKLTVASHPFSLEIPEEFAQMEIDFSHKNSEIVKKSEFFYALVARFCSLLYYYLWLGWYTCFNEKTTLVLESGFGVY